MMISRGMGIMNPKKMKAGGKVKAFKSHMMYDKKTGKGVKAPTMAKHLELKGKGFGHTKPTKMKKGGSVKDACYHKVKASYKVFPSAYASGAIAKCRKKGGKK
tara:strand:+ start:612 stop:920 length:309 start_codon:yes stop_codon:yes gene_type:complete